ncbi:hypothetical protein [Bacteriovorax sp. DB6_IX]|uniref:hypothetical protein n=1 Tax=Bacteriovorax sp. DB6_IX TaxID=1353530 RepID=UPI000389F1FC|nr:hypothetical protein [Bacteriovorax sp. DB6_IX]EQC51839.1 hypothetical protein M901_2681 [Bacteriovorax sp. DB6_IX]
MKKMIIVTLLGLGMSVYANGLDVAYRYQDAMDAHKIEKNTSRAKVILEDVLGNISNDHPLFEDIYKSYLEYNGMKASDDLEKAIKFATGRKESTYCKGVGLVHSKLFHNDNTESTLILGNGNRSFLDKDTYSVMNEGRWTYQVDTGYREPVKSEVWINSSSENHYDIQELRQRENGRDKGKYTAKWRDGSMSSSTSSNGSPKEPIPMFLGMDLHRWGNSDLGYRINFKVGESDKTNSGEGTFGHGRILLSGERTVKKHFEKYSVKDFDNKERNYSDCFLVETKVKFAGIERQKK